MKSPITRILLLSLALLGTQLSTQSEARSPGKNKEAQKERANQQRNAPRQPARSAPANRSGKAQGPPRNPLTGSSVDRGGGTRAKAKPDAPRNTNPNRGNNPAAKGPGPVVKQNPNKATNNSPDRKPDPAAVRPAPRGSGVAAAKPEPKRPAPSRPHPKGSGTVAKEPSPKGPGPMAKGPAAKDPGPGGNRPENTYQRPKPRPSTVAKKRPDATPDLAGPRGGGRGSFVPGKVTYPGQLSKAKGAPAGKNPKHPAYHANRAKPQQLNQAISNARVSNTNVNNNWGNQWTNNKTTVWNNHRTVFNRPVVISPNFQRSVNYAYRPSSWGARPWWSNSSYHTWHQGSWNYGWNRNWYSYHAYRPYYGRSINYFPGYHPYHSSYLSGLSWGLGAWTLGSLYYDTGYNTYHNPYQAPPIHTRTTVINYSQPISVVASRLEPEPEAAALTSEEMSTAAIERARAEFQNGDYLAALKSTDESISYASGDSALHEFRALCLFALGRYGDAAGVLNPVLASGPGWDWATMAAFYGEGEVYTGQLRKLEAYVDGSPDAADAHFVLGYHYLVAGFIDESYGMFDRVVALQPDDTVALQLRNLAESSSPNAAGEETEAEALTASPESGVSSEAIDPTDIEGEWKASSGEGKAITLTLANNGSFTWNYEGSTETKVLSGDWSVDEEGRLVLASADVQMVADISLDGGLLRFILAGSPVGDPGLSFQRP